jgi:hypothetical protein
MLKDTRIIKRVGGILDDATESVTRNVLRDYSAIDGREEELTAQLRGELNRRLLREVEKRLNGKSIRNCTFRVATFTKKQENRVGADLVGIVQLRNGPTTISKAFLAQSKVGFVHSRFRGQPLVRTYSANVLSQVDKMLSLSSDAFVFIYTLEGIFCVPAFQVKLAGSRTIDTEHQPYHSIGRFYEEFFKCFIGDHHIAGGALKGADLEAIADATSAQALLLIRADLKVSAA